MGRDKLKNIGIIDAHTHIMLNDSVKNSLDELKNLKEKRGYKSQTVLSVEAANSMGILLEYSYQNPLCILYKLKNPVDRAFGGFWYNETGVNHYEQAKGLYEMGFDGIKMIEGKPEVRKELGKKLCDESYHEAYKFMQEKGFPILLHVADPPEFWDFDKIPGWAMDAGWYWGDGTYETKEGLMDEVREVLEKFPMLKMIIAHFAFYSDDMSVASEMLERYPNLYFDLTSGIEMYHNFSRNPDIWREFFVKYQNRLIFGTDNYNIDDEKTNYDMSVINQIERGFLEKSDSFKGWDSDFVGIGLSDEILEKIYSKNYLDIVGEAPKKIDLEKVNEYLKKYPKDDIILEIEEFFK